MKRGLRIAIYAVILLVVPVFMHEIVRNIILSQGTPLYAAIQLQCVAFCYFIERTIRTKDA